MAKKRTGFEEIFKKISLETQITEMRPAVLRDVFSEANRKRAAVALNNELRHFHSTFIATFIASQVPNPTVDDRSPIQGSNLSLNNLHWVSLSERWRDRKENQGVEAPSFFSYGAVGTKKGNKVRAKKQLTPRPLQTLEDYLQKSWGPNKAIDIVGYVTADDIIFKTSKGEDVKLKQGKANPDAAFLGKLKTNEGKDITNLTETFTIGFRAFPNLKNLRDLGKNNKQQQLKVTRLFVPLGSNTASKGFPLSKLTNNAEIWGDRYLRPTVEPLLNWYYRVKLPHVFKQFYKTKGLVGR